MMNEHLVCEHSKKFSFLRPNSTAFIPERFRLMAQKSSPSDMQSPAIFQCSYCPRGSIRKWRISSAKLSVRI